MGVTTQHKQMYRVVLDFDFGLTRSVFVYAKSRSEAERKALRKYPEAKGICRVPFPQN